MSAKPTLPVPNDHCPIIQIDGAGWLVGITDDDQRFQAYALTDAALPLFSKPPFLSDLNDANPPRWIRRAKDGSLLALLLHDAGLHVAAIQPNGSLAWVSGDSPTGVVIPSRPGELFLDVSGDDRHIDQLTCTGSLSDP